MGEASSPRRGLGTGTANTALGEARVEPSEASRVARAVGVGLALGLALVFLARRRGV